MLRPEPTPERGLGHVSHLLGEHPSTLAHRRDGQRRHKPPSIPHNPTRAANSFRLFPKQRPFPLSGALALLSLCIAQQHWE